ncbi:MAG TPA: nucleotide exchange factor GrpE [Xanthobacteraceae bacterium]|jgi:molecular chaperone GrpE|nr:nucleotide exchange factor GrpE [Xanthobacteraceae bacterium]
MTESTASTAGAGTAEDRTAQPAAAAAPPAPAPEAKAAATDATVAPPDPLADAVREAAEFKDKLLRTLAEMENLRRRTEREVADARLYGIAGFARDILGVADNMDRALQSLGANLRENADANAPGTKALLEGVELTERELLKVLDKHGIKKFEPAKGEKFDPNFHQAMYEVPDLSLPGGTVAQMVQAGFKISERMLRPALVAVVKHPPKPAAEKPPAEKPSVEAASSTDGPEKNDAGG